MPEKETAEGVSVQLAPVSQTDVVESVIGTDLMIKILRLS
jgi:hypothetical protein